MEAAHKYVDSFFAATGSTVVCRHAYLDENGNYSNFTVSVRKDALNEKLTASMIVFISVSFR